MTKEERRIVRAIAVGLTSKPSADAYIKNWRQLCTCGLWQAKMQYEGQGHDKDCPANNPIEDDGSVEYRFMETYLTEDSKAVAEAAELVKAKIVAEYLDVKLGGN